MKHMALWKKRPPAAQTAEDPLLRKLRRRMVRINMALLTAVLIGVIGALLLMLHTQNKRMTNSALDRMLFSRIQPGPGERPLMGGVVIELGKDGALIHATFPSELTGETVARMATLALKQEQPRGEIAFNGYSFAYALGDAKALRKMVFFDLSGPSDMMGNAVMICLGAGAVSLCALWGVSVYLAERAIRPVREAFYRQKNFIADASHELKTPLAILNANLSLLRSSMGEADKKQRYAAAMEEQSVRMGRLVSDMLELARLDSGEAVSRFTPVNLSGLTQNTLLSFEALFFEHALVSGAHIQPEVWVTGDAAELERLLCILLDNACRHTPRNGTVEISLSHERGHALLCIENSGEGISSGHLNHLFDRFYRVDSGRGRESGGYGLGLAIAKSIAVRHGAEITAESEEGKYTRFVVRFLKTGKGAS